MTQPLETAYVEIVPDFSGFGREVRQDLRVELARLEIQMREVGNHIERSMADIGRRAGTRLGNEIRAGARSAIRALDEVGDEAAEMGRDIFRGAINGRNGLASLSRSGVLDKIKDGFDAVGKAASDLFGVLGSAPVIITGLLITLLPAVILLAAALADLIGLVGLLPSGFGVLLASIIPLIVAFQNFGDAVSAVASGDLEKINEALAKLSPSAAVVAREIGVLLPNLRLLQRAVQEAFFFPLRGALPQLVDVLLPSLIHGMGQVAGAFGRLFRAVIDFFSLPEQITLINNLFASTARIIDALTPAFVRFLAGFLEVGNTALPIFEKLAKAALEAFGEFGDFIAEAARTGDLDEFIQDALDTMKELVGLLKALGGLFGTIFSATDDEGRSLLGTLTDLVITLDEFLKTAQGQASLKLLADAAGVLVGILGSLLFLFASVITFLFFFARALEDVANWAIGLGEDLRKLIDDVLGFSDAVVNTIGEIPNKLIGLSAKFVDAGKNLIKSFISGFRQAGNFIGDVAGDITGHIKGGLNSFIKRINAGIEGLDALLPFSLSRIPLLAGGGLALGPSMIAERGQPELALPLHDPRAQRAIQEAIGMHGGSGTTVNFGAGAINVNFDGVMPTEQEARTVGQAVGHGIIDTLTRQGIRMSVRAI